MCSVDGVAAPTLPIAPCAFNTLVLATAPPALFPWSGLAPPPAVSPRNVQDIPETSDGDLELVQAERADRGRVLLVVAAVERPARDCEGLAAALVRGRAAPRCESAAARELGAGPLLAEVGSEARSAGGGAASALAYIGLGSAADR